MLGHSAGIGMSGAACRWVQACGALPPAPRRGGLYRDEQLEVSGIGEKKADDFGEVVLEQIDEFEFCAR